MMRGHLASGKLTGYEGILGAGMQDSWSPTKWAKEQEAEARAKEEFRCKTAHEADLIGSELMLRQEMAHVLGDPAWLKSDQTLPQLISSLQGEQIDKRPVALCLSGGGIRSATFSLGVLQWLANKGQLQEYNYLSTVSGGGYVGSFLVNGLWQAYSSRRQRRLVEFGHEKPMPEAERDQKIASLKHLDPDKATAEGRAIRGELASLRREVRALRRADAAGRIEAKAWLHRLGNSAGTEHAAEVAGAERISEGGRDPVAPLRAYSNYLSPTGGLSTDAFSVVAIFLRNLVLNLLVWLPLLAAAIALPRLFIALLTGVAQTKLPGSMEWWLVWGALVAIILGIGYIVADLPAPNWRPPAPPQTPPNDRFNLACFLPITLAAFVLSLLGAWTALLHGAAWWQFALAGATAHVVGVGLGALVRKYVRKLEMRSASLRGLAVVAIVGGIGGALASLVLSEVGQGTVASQLSATQQLSYASLSVPAMTGAFWLAMALHAGLMGRFSTEEDREWWARATAAWLKFTLVWLAAFGIVVWLPLLILEHAAEAGLTAVTFGVGGSALGVATALIGYWSKHGTQVKSKAQGAIKATGLKLLDVMAGAVLLAVLLSLSLTWSVALDRCSDWEWARTVCKVPLHAQTNLLRERATLGAAVAGLAGGEHVRVLAPEIDPVSAEIAALGTSAGAQVYAFVLLKGSGAAMALASVLLVAMATLMAYCMGANQFSLHGMYGNRLVRAYLGSGRRVRSPHWFTRFDPDDNPRMADMSTALRGADGRPRLFPLVNIALNLVKPSEKRLDLQQRKAASFFATPLHCGAAHFGFRPTEFYAGGMSLGRAMTISGAAASPNMGYHSSPLVTAVMTLFNVRLGWWSPNPKFNTDWHKDRPGLGMGVMWAEASGATGDEDNFAYLSDGGHFDNTGVYEMVRRRCRRIVLVDATCDGEFKWRDLIDVIRKIRVDFGVPIELNGELPGGGRKPDQARSLTGTIKYSSRDPEIRDGVLIVLKPLLLESDPPELAAYARDSAKEDSKDTDPDRFPHQSTSDQFYDEQQFESYRLLGYITAEAALSGQPAPKLPRLRRVKAPLSPALAAKAEAKDDGRAEAAASLLSGADELARAGVDGVGQIVQQVGTNMALVAALAVGGTLGVAGSIALKPTEISLSAEDRTLLKGGIKGGVDVAQMSLSAEDRKILQEGMRIRLDDEPAKRLEEAANYLDGVIARWPKTAPLPGPPGPGPAGTTTIAFDPSSRALLEQLRDSVRRAAPTPDVASSQPDLTTAVSDLKDVLTKLQNDPALSKKLGDVVTGLQRTMESGAPRRNIRGQDGGNR